MKLISPAQLEQREQEDTKAEQARVFAQAMEALQRTGDEFADELARAIKRVSKAAVATPAVHALERILRGVSGAIRTLAVDENGGTSGTDGHEGRRSTSGGSDRAVGTNRSRTASGGTRHSAAPVSVDGAPVKRGRGRPKGSKNRKTLEREAAARAAKREQQSVVRKSAGVKRPSKPVARKPARKPAGASKRASDSRHAGRTGRRQGAAKKGHLKR